MVGHYFRFPDKPSSYELSYMCPRGISGAPLLCKIDDELVICGMTIGNEITEMVVNSFREVEVGTNNITTYEKTEAFHRGIAVQAESFFSLKSELLGSTIIEYLRKEDLIID